MFYFIFEFCLQDNKTPLEEAMDYGHIATVHYFVKILDMDITKFDEVMPIQLLEFCSHFNIQCSLRGVVCYARGWVGLIYVVVYTTKLIIGQNKKIEEFKKGEWIDHCFKH